MNQGYILNSPSEKYLYNYLRSIEKLCTPESGYLKSFNMFFKIACNIYDSKFTLNDVKTKQDKVIIEISEEIFKILKKTEDKHYDATIYALIVLSASYVCDRLLAKEGITTITTPLSISLNEIGEIRALQNLKKLFGLPRNENEINWKITD